jgi:hypothetical protein
VRGRLRKLASDLLHLEITTIVQPKIVSTKMANPRCALMDLASTYRHELTRQHLPPPADLDELGGCHAFQQIQQWANSGIAARTARGVSSTAEAAADLARLYEIQDKVALIVGIFRALQQRQVVDWDNAYTREEVDSHQRPFPLTLDEMMLIRKLWELGLEEIAMQTVIQADGDIITRLHPTSMAASAQSLRDMHRESMQVSVAFWRELVGMVEALVGLLARRLL